MSEPIIIATIVAARGLRGELKLQPVSDHPSWAGVLPCAELFLPASGERLTLSKVVTTQQGRQVLLKCAEIKDRTTADKWIGATVLASAQDIPPTAFEEYWMGDLIGMAVLDHQTQSPWGTVKDVMSSGSRDFLEITPVNSTQTVLVPFESAFFPVVDEEKRIITVQNLDGLI